MKSKIKSSFVRRSTQCAALALLLATAAIAQSNPWNWHTLELTARSGFILSGRVKMKIEKEPERTLLATTTSARAFGALVARSRTQSILDPTTGHAREYLSFSPKRGRHYVFNETSYVVKKLKPREGYDAPLDGWDVASNHQFPYPASEGGPATVYDPYGMLLNLKHLELNQVGDSAVTYVATSKGPQRYDIRVGESRTRRRSYRNAATRRKQTVDTEEFLLLFEPDEKNASNKGLLGMSGSIEIWVEARSKTLIRVSGKIENMPGRVVLKLSSMG